MIYVLRRRFRPRVVNSRSIFETILNSIVIAYTRTIEYYRLIVFTILSVDMGEDHRRLYRRSVYDGIYTLIYTAEEFYYNILYDSNIAS